MVFTPHHTPNNNSQAASKPGKLLSLVLIFLLVAGVGVYITLTNTLATKGYEIKELEKQVAAAKFTARQLEAEAAARQTYKTLDESGIPEGFVAVEKVEYLAATPLAGVAVK